MAHRRGAADRPASAPSLVARLLGTEHPRPRVLPFLSASLLTVVLAMWILAVPLVLAGLALKASAALAWARGVISRAKSRLGLALLIDCCAMLAWGRHLLTSPVPAMIGGLGIALAALAYARLLRWETLERHQWGVRQRLKETKRPEEWSYSGSNSRQ